MSSVPHGLLLIECAICFPAGLTARSQDDKGDCGCPSGSLNVVQSNENLTCVVPRAIC